MTRNQKRINKRKMAIAEAIYYLNKKAKSARDLGLRDLSSRIYRMKDRALLSCHERGYLHYAGYHMFDTGWCPYSLSYYRMGGFGFHSRVRFSDAGKRMNLGTIGYCIESSVDRGRVGKRYSVRTAVSVLREYGII